MVDQLGDGRSGVSSPAAAEPLPMGWGSALVLGALGRAEVAALVVAAGRAPMCGWVGALHCGHVVVATTVAFQLARRERVLERDIFRFGTATSGPLLCRRG